MAATDEERGLHSVAWEMWAQAGADAAGEAEMARLWELVQATRPEGGAR